MIRADSLSVPSWEIHDRQRRWQQYCFITPTDAPRVAIIHTTRHPRVAALVVVGVPWRNGGVRRHHRDLELHGAGYSLAFPGGPGLNQAEGTADERTFD